MRKIEQIKIKQAYGSTYCVSMYVAGILVDAVNGVTEREKDDYIRLFHNGKLFTNAR